MWPFSKKPKVILRDFTYGAFYDALMEAGIQENFQMINDHRERNRQIKKFESFRHEAFKSHLNTLSREVQNAFRENRHPSQNHALTKEAGEVVEDLKRDLQAFDFIESVDLGLYLRNRLILKIEITKEADFEEVFKKLPWLYKGYEVKLSQAE